MSKSNYKVVLKIRVAYECESNSPEDALAEANKELKDMFENTDIQHVESWEEKVTLNP